MADSGQVLTKQKHPEDYEDTRGSTTSQEYKNEKENTKVTQYFLVLLVDHYVLFVIWCEPINISFVKLIT